MGAYEDVVLSTSLRGSPPLSSPRQRVHISPRPAPSLLSSPPLSPCEDPTSRDPRCVSRSISPVRPPIAHLPQTLLEFVSRRPPPHLTLGRPRDGHPRPPSAPPARYCHTQRRCVVLARLRVLTLPRSATRSPSHNQAAHWPPRRPSPRVHRHLPSAAASVVYSIYLVPVVEYVLREQREHRARDCK